MKAFSIAAAAGLFVAAPVGAQQRPVGAGLRLPVPPSPNHFSWERGSGFNHRLGGGFGGRLWIIERAVPVVIEREVVVVTPPSPAQAISGTPNRDVPEKARKPYVVGASYAELPDGCMKMIEGGVSYFYCAGEWYRQVGKQYRAVERKL